MVVNFIPLALVALLTLGGLGTLALIAIVALIKRRPGIAAAALVGGLLLVGLLVPATMGIFYVRMQSPGPFEFAGPMEVGGHPVGDMAVRLKGSLMIGVLVVAGIVVALIAALARRPADGSPSTGHRGGARWWPVLLLLPLLFFFFVGTVRVQTSRRHALEDADRSVRRAMEAATREQQLAARQAEAIGAKIARHIEQTDIHKLMDEFDAPRIVLPSPLPTPLPALLPWIDKTYVPIPVASSPTSPPAATVAVEASKIKEPSHDAQPAADAVEPAEVVAAEVANHVVEKESDPAVEVESADVVKSASNAEIESRAPQPPEPVDEAAELSTPMGAAAAVTSAVETERPDWVKSPPKRVGQVQREVLVTDEWSTEAECDRERDVALLVKTYEHIQGLVGMPYHSDPLEFKRNSYARDGFALTYYDYRLRQLDSAGITLHFVRTEIAREEYLETVDRSVGPMMKLYTLVEFTPAVDKQLLQLWDAFRRRERFAVVGIGAGGIVSTLGFVYGLLKVDTWTKGYYTKRLFLGVPAAIAGIAGLLAWLA